MFELDFPWLLVLVPAPILVGLLVSPYKERQEAIRVPCFAPLADKPALTPRKGAVVLRRDLLQRIVAPLAWILVVLALARPQLVRRWATPVLILLPVMIALGFLVRRYWPRLRSGWLARRESLARSEAPVFRRFETACHAGDPRAASRQLPAWLDRIAPPGSIGTLSGLVATADDPELGRAVTRMQERLSAASSKSARVENWSGDDLCRAVKCYRSRRQEARRALPADERRLAPLNPESGPA